MCLRREWDVILNDYNLILKTTSMNFFITSLIVTIMINTLNKISNMRSKNIFLRMIIRSLNEILKRDF